MQILPLTFYHYLEKEWESKSRTHWIYCSHATKKTKSPSLDAKNPDASSAKASADSTIALLSLAQTSTRNRILRAANQTDQSENKAISARHSWEIFKAQTCRDRVLQYRSKACSGKPGIYKNITSRPLALDSHNLTLKPLKIKTMYWPKWFAKLMHVRFRFSLATSESHIHFFISSLATLGPQLRFFPQTGPWRNLAGPQRRWKSAS